MMIGDFGDFADVFFAYKEPKIGIETVNMMIG